MSLYVVQVFNFQGHQYLHNGRIGQVEAATKYSSPSAAERAADNFQRKCPNAGIVSVEPYPRCLEGP